MDQSPHPLSQNYYSQRLRLHYVEWENDGAPPILMVHGGMDHCRNWDWAARALSEHYAIIAPDLRGHGDSEWSAGGTYRELDFVYDIEQLVRLRGFDKITIVGHSFGGFVSLIYAGLNPDIVDKMIIIEGLVRSVEDFNTRLAEPTHQRIKRWMEGIHKVSSRHPKRYRTFAEALDRMRSENSHLNEQQATHLTRHALKQNEDGSPSWTRNTSTSSASGNESAARYCCCAAKTPGRMIRRKTDGSSCSRMRVWSTFPMRDTGCITTNWRSS